MRATVSQRTLQSLKTRIKAAAGDVEQAANAVSRALIALSTSRTPPQILQAVKTDVCLFPASLSGPVLHWALSAQSYHSFQAGFPLRVDDSLHRDRILSRIRLPSVQSCNTLNVQTLSVLLSILQLTDG